MAISTALGEFGLMRPSEKDLQRNAIRLLVFDATRMGCELLAQVLESSSDHVNVVGQSTSSIIDNNCPLEHADVALISENLSEGPGSGFKLVRAIRNQGNGTRCIVLMDHYDSERVVEAFSVGAVGVCVRSESCEVLNKCIDRVHQGQIWANSEQLRFVLEKFCGGARVRLTDARGDALLTPREEEIVSLVADGLRNRDIAERLNLSEHTVRNHLFRIFEKLGISNRSELILYFMRQRDKAASSS